tara:strand:+ start:256 stop:612 length:357 start_codon:yes stop_codon:yes gene_type:complete
MDLKLGENNDLIIENNELVMIDGSDLVKQLLLQRLKSFRGEWFLDSSLGLPYFQDILKKETSINTVSNIFKDQILGTPGVLELEEFNLDFTESTRQLIVNFVVRTLEGSIKINLEEVI